MERRTDVSTDDCVHVQFHDRPELDGETIEGGDPYVGGEPYAWGDPSPTDDRYARVEA